MAEVSTSQAPDAQLFRDAFNASPIGIAVENLDGQPLFVNPAFCRFLGFTEKELCSKHCVDFSPREDAEKDWALFQQLKAGSIDHYQMEKRYFRRDGSLVWGSLSISLLKGRSSPLVLAMVEDITEKKAAEEARFRHAALVESSDDAIATGNLDGMIVTWNAGAEKMYGYTEAEAIGKPITMLVPPELPDEESKILETLRAGGRIEHFETTRVSKTGKRINVSLTISPIKDSSGKIVGISGIARDITERKQAEETLSKSEERLLLAAQIGKMYAYDWNVATDEVVRSPEAASVLGMSNEIRLTRQQLLEIVHPEDRARWIASVAELTPSAPDSQLTYRALRRDGSEVWLEKRARAFFDETGKMLRVIGMVADVTDQKLAEGALRASEGRLRLVQQAARLGVFERDVRSGSITWAEGLESLYGMPPGSLEGKTLAFFRDLIHPADRERTTHLIQQALKTGQPMEAEWRVVWPNGSVHWIAGRWQVLMDDSGQPSRVVGVNMDVTERKLTEDALRNSEERLRLSQWVAHIGTFDLNLQTGVDIWQPETEALYGLPPGSFGGTLAAFEDLIHPDDRQRITELTQEMMRTGQPAEAEWRVIWPDGSIHWITGRGQVLMDESGKPSRMLGVNMDVTKRKLAEDALRESEEKFHSVFREAGVGMVIVSPEGRFLAANTTFSDLLGYTEAELLEKTVESVTYLEDWPAFSNLLHEALTGGHGFQWFEKRCLHKSGRIVYTQSSASLIRDRHGNPQYFIGEVLDISKRKEAEQALLGMSRKLIESQEQERARIARELHDNINQRLALLSVEVEAFRQNPPDTATEVSIVFTEVRERINEISADVQSLSHQLHSSQLEYLGIVAAARSFCREFSMAQNVEVDFSHDDIPCSVPADISLCLFRVLQEALHNVAKYSQVRHVDVRLSYSANHLGLTVSDHGVGFDPESALHKGGLGLTSMKERVRLVNGTISIESKPMQGTTIHVRVPLKAEHESEKLAG